MLAAAELDGADDMTASVQRDLVAGLRQLVEDEAAGRDESAALVRAVHTTHWTVVHCVADHACRRDRRRMPCGTLAGQSALTLGVFPQFTRGHTPTHVTGSLHTVFHSTAFVLTRDVLIATLVALWLGLAFRTHRDAKRRIDDGRLVGVATLLGLVPIAGPLLYLLFRPPETLEETHARSVEIRAIEERLGRVDPHCPVCRALVEATYLVCPVCTTTLKEPCVECKAPLDPLWQACPYCATPVGAAVTIDLDTALTAETAAFPTRKRKTHQTRPAALQ
jgi:double zinc ribbon protein